MPKVRVIFLLGVFSTLFLPAGASAQQNSMQLLTPDVGWALIGDRLFWTTDGGSGWRDITPAMPSQEHVAAVFFLDTSNGWLVLSAWDQAADKWQFDLASTGDGGTTWSVAPLNLPDLGPRFAPLGGGARIDFVDSLHGWINFDVTSSSNFRLGGLAMTTDGGRTWDWAPGGAGTAGSIRFVTTKDGWVAGGPGNTGLYVTHDGSKSWQQVSLKPPPQADPAIYPTYEVPIFRDSQHGFLPVNYSGPEGTPSKLVVFATDHGGKTWKPDRVLPHLKETSIRDRPLVAVVASALITAAVSNHTRLTLTTVTPAGETTASADIACPGPAIVELSFVDSNRGWVRPCQLLSTTDGGNTWTDITPGRARKTHPGPAQVPAVVRPPDHSCPGPFMTRLFCPAGYK